MSMQSTPTPDHTVTDDVVNGVLADMPDCIAHSRDLLNQFAATLPDGTPDEVRDMLHRTFIAGAVAHMEQVRLAFTLPSIADGNPSDLLSAVAALGIGAQQLLHAENRKILERSAGKPGKLKLVIAGEAAPQAEYKGTLQ